MVKEEVPTKPGRDTSGIPRRRRSWLWLPAGSAVLVMGMVAGAAVWQAPRGTSTAHSTGKKTQATKALAKRFVAAGLWSEAQYDMFASNAVWIDVPDHNNTVTGFGLQAAYTSGALGDPKTTQRLMFAGPNSFITQWTMQSSEGFVLHGVSVSQVRKGKIIRQSIYHSP